MRAAPSQSDARKVSSIGGRKTKSFEYQYAIAITNNPDGYVLLRDDLYQHQTDRQRKILSEKLNIVLTFLI